MVVWYKRLTFTVRRYQRICSSFSYKIYSQEIKSLNRRAMDKVKDSSAPLCFNSRSKAPNEKFSNFYEVKIEMAEGCFNSVEHYFQAMKFVDENHSRFEIKGDLGRQKIAAGCWKPMVAKGRFIKSAGSKSGTAKHKLTLRSNGLDRERAKEKMKEGLRQKFEKEPFKSSLLETLDRPLVHTPMRGKTDYWTARVDKKSGDIIGENNMGKLLMEVRRELIQKARKVIQGEESQGEDTSKIESKSTGSEEEITNEGDASTTGDIEGHHVEKRVKSDEQKQSEEPAMKQGDASAAGGTEGYHGEKRKRGDETGEECDEGDASTTEGTEGYQVKKNVKSDEQKQSEEPAMKQGDAGTAGDTEGYHREKKRDVTEDEGDASTTRDTEGYVAKKRKREETGVESDVQKQSENPRKKRKKTKK